MWVEQFVGSVCRQFTANAFALPYVREHTVGHTSLSQSRSRMVAITCLCFSLKNRLFNGEFFNRQFEYRQALRRGEEFFKLKVCCLLIGRDHFRCTLGRVLFGRELARTATFEDRVRGNIQVSVRFPWAGSSKCPSSSCSESGSLIATSTFEY